jgi:uncharacterized membrane protein YqaE (UPF0057 family)
VRVITDKGKVFVLWLHRTILLCFIFPPLAVFDKGCGSMLLILLLTALGWLTGTIVALIICLADRNKIGE